MPHQQISSGYNNVPGLKTFPLLNPPLFDEYYGGLLSEWYDFEKERRSADNSYAELGDPYVKWIFFFITPEEYDYLKSMEGPVTIYTWKKTQAEWGSMSADMHVPPPNPNNWELTGWEDVEVMFHNLVDIP